MKPLLIGLVMLVPTPSLYAAQLAVRVTGLEAPGEIHLAVYDDPRVFEGDRGDQGGPQPGIIAGTIQPAGPESFTSTFELPTGVYAVGIFHDLNGDGALSKNFLGMPKEPFGFSNNARARFGPPSFEEAAISVKEKLSITIDLD